MIHEKYFRWNWRFFFVCAVVGIICIVCSYWLLCWSHPVTTVFVVRHADRDGSNDDLSAPGLVRANEVVHVLGEAGITAIYRSDTVRNEKTARPLSDHLGIVPIVYPPTNTQQLVSDILSHHAGARVLVVGHSNTVSEIVDRLGGPSMPHIDDSVFDDLFIVNRCWCARRSASTIHLKYGDVTSP